MALDAQVIQETPYPKVMGWDLVERWADGIPFFDKGNPLNPEWKKTPVFSLDLSRHGYGPVHIKDESSKLSNPTGTIKDRAAWELATLFRDYARGLYLQKQEGLLNGTISQLSVPRFSYVTAGNVGRATSVMFQRHGLPPMKLLVSSSIPEERLNQLKGLHADIYMIDLSKKPLSTQEIKELTNNRGGIDITSVMSIEPQAVLYDWHVHESFNESPDKIFVPYGSGRLFENYITWQMRNSRGRDPRLQVPLARLLNIGILGAQPVSAFSVADKLTPCHNPFVLYTSDDISALGTLAFTGKDTGVYQVHEEMIRQAYELLSPVCATEPSACAGLALYLQRYDQGKIPPDNKVLIVNTGKGI